MTTGDRLKRPGWQIGAALALIALALGSAFAFYAGSYFLAMHEDERCFSGKSLGALDRGTVEDCLFLYTQSPCRMNERIPGVDYRSGTCVSYNILGLDPIHVIYGVDGRVKNQVSAYE